MAGHPGNRHAAYYTVFNTCCVQFGRSGSAHCETYLDTAEPRMPYPHWMDVAGDDGTKLPKDRDTYSLELSVVSQPAVWPILCFAFIDDRCSVLLLSARLPPVGWGIAGNCSGLQ